MGHQTELAAAEPGTMNDFNRKVKDASARVNEKIGQTTEQVEKEAAEFIKYLNDEVVPAVRQHSTKALRTAAEKMTELANYMERNSAARK
jgi:glutamyl-tRNA reductase